MKKSLTVASVVLAMMTVTPDISAKKVHTIGDSTMANYDENATVTRGWCQYLQQFLDGITVNNRGKNGASSKSFYKETPYWASVKKQMEEGDYVLIQFAHNDEKTQGMDGDEVKAYYTSIGDNTTAASTDYRGTNPSTTYKDYLRLYVDETRALGCTPVLVGPVCRMYFSGNTIRRNGRHDLGDNFSRLTENGILTSQKVPADDRSMDYVESMRQVAAEKDVPFIDLTTATADLYLSYGQSDCMAIISDGDGQTHLSATGAALIARRFAQLAQEAGVMAEYVSLSSDFSISPSDGFMGQGYIGQTLTKEFLITGFDITPASGNLSLSVTGNAEISVDTGSTWVQSAAIPYDGGTIIGKISARLPLTEVGGNNATLTVNCPGGLSRDIAITATAVELSGGMEVNAYWRLESNADCELTGPAQVIEESWHGMELQRYQAPNANTVWPDWTGYDATRITQRNVIEGSVWPAGEIDEVSTRYIEFGLAPVEGTSLAIDEISCFLCGCGGNGMCLHVWYSGNPDFSDARLIFSQSKLPANNMIHLTETPVLTVEPGSAVRLRFYPWYNGEANGKTLCLSDVKIHGYASDLSAMPVVATDAEDVETTWFDLCGRRLAAPAGLCISRTVYSDGSVSVKKTVN